MRTHCLKRRCLLVFGVVFLLLNGCDDTDNTKKCSTGQHMLKNGTCEMNTNERCGKPDSTDVVNCMSFGNAAEGICNTDGTCVATACRVGYHLIQGQCVEDTANACGSTSNDCTALSGWVAGVCEAGKCAATSCAVGYCLQDGICVDGAMNADACGVEGGAQVCKKCFSEEAEMRCAEGKCVWANCPPTECYYQDETCTNADAHCGRECLNCSSAHNATEGTCDIDSGMCMITACKDNYHLAEKDGKTTCMLNTIEACGSSDNNCTQLDGWAAGDCVERNCHALACSNGYHLKSEEGIEIEFDECVEDNERFCGADRVNCTETIAGWSEGTCTDGQCQISRCQFYNCLNGKECVDGLSDVMCGYDGLACQSCGASEACFLGDCYELYCRDTSECTRFRGVNVVVCTFGKCVDATCVAGYTEVDDRCKADCNGVTAACAANEICVGGQCRCGTGSSTCSPSQKCCLIKGTPTNICVDEEEVGSDTFACP